MNDGEFLAVVLGFVLEGDFVCVGVVDLAGDFALALFAFAGSGDLLAGLGEGADLVAFVAGDAVVDFPLAGEGGGVGGRRKGRGRKEEEGKENRSHGVFRLVFEFDTACQN